MQKPDVQVRNDDRIRLLGTLLALTDFSEQAQAEKRHQPHAHARATSKRFREARLDQHPAVVALQIMLDKNTPLEALFTLIVHFTQVPDLRVSALPKWTPSDWDKALIDFYKKANLEAYWQQESMVWDPAIEQATQVFQDAQIKTFLRPFLGTIKEELVFVPNLLYPADREIGVRTADSVIAITPPPLAWGESPPWPYNEETFYAHSYRAAISQFSSHLLKSYLRRHQAEVLEASKKEIPVGEKFRAIHRSWEEQFIALFTTAIVAIYLEDHISESEARAFVMMEKKAKGLQILPGTVSVLRRYQSEVGNRYRDLIDYLPHFPGQLRIAKRFL
ncbi:hypothetical protein MASR2M15_26320 [Anaerolineales bacterium]